MSSANTEHIVFHCACAAKLKLPATAAGRTAKCPKCGQKLRVPAATTAKAATEHRAAPEDGGGLDSLLYDLATQTESATSVEIARPDAETPGAPCPLCGKLMARGANIGVACGYDTKTGRKHKAASTAPIKAIKLAKGAGTIVLGCVLSAVSALIGAGVWFGVAMATNYELGFIAWGVGLLAGGGMVLGCRKQNDLAGLASSCMALFGVFAAKAMIFAYLIYGVVPVDPGGNPSLLGLFFGTVFGPLDILFMLLALASAYKIGSGTLGGD